MADLPETIDRARVVSDLSQRRLAALAGIDQSTVSRILDGKVNPTWSVVNELLTVTGSNPFTPEADVEAIRAARCALDPQSGVGRTPDSDKWLQRWARIGLVNDDGEVAAGKRAALLFRASTVTRLINRRGVTGFSPDTDLETTVSAWNSAGIEWAFTGSYALALARPGALWVPALYVRDVAQAQSEAGLRTRLPGDNRMEVRLIPFDGVSEMGRTQVENGMWVADRDQVLLDSYASGGRAREAADITLGLRV